VFVIGNELWKVNILAADEFSIQEVDFAETTVRKSHAFTHTVNILPNIAFFNLW